MSIVERFRLRCRADDERGFTIVEILMATTILLIAFSGIMALMVATTYMNTRAREKATMVNVANSYVERVRQMKYDDIGTSTSTPPGTLAPYTQAIDGYSVTVTPTVAPMTDSRIWISGQLKVLTLHITARTGPTDPNPLSYTAETIIKKTDTGVDESALLPLVQRSVNSPADGAIVRGKQVQIGGNAAAQGTGVKLTSMNIYCDGVPLKDQYGNTAQWSLSTESYQTNPDFQWDTLAVNDSNVPLSIDGAHTIRFEAWDSNGKQGYIEWQVIVDNAPPQWPTDGWVSATPKTSTLMRLDWSTAFDGNSPAYGYRIRPRHDDSSTPDPTAWPTLASFDVSSAPTANFATSAFSRYYFQVNALGPPTLSAESTGSSAVVGISRPELNGCTWSNVGTNKTMKAYVTVKVTPPTFPYTSATSTLYKSTSASMASSSAVGTFLGWTPPQYQVANLVGAGWPAAPAYYYQVKTVITPSGSATPVTLYTQVVGPGGIYNGTGPLDTVGW